MNLTITKIMSSSTQKDKLMVNKDQIECEHECVQLRQLINAEDCMKMEIERRNS